jgi:hypothetical protein
MGNIWMIQRGQHFSFALEAQHAPGLAGVSIGENLQRHVTFQLGIASAVDLAHAARADRREDLVRSETSPSGERHRM